MSQVTIKIIINEKISNSTMFDIVDECEEILEDKLKTNDFMIICDDE